MTLRRPGGRENVVGPPWLCVWRKVAVCVSASFLRGILPSASCGPVWKFPPPGVRWSRLPSALFNQLHSPHFLPSFTVGFNPVELGAHLVENSGKFGRSPPPRTRAGRSGPYIRPPPPTPASFTATAEPKAARHLAKKKKQTIVKKEKIAP